MVLFRLKMYLRVLSTAWSTFGLSKEFLRRLFVMPLFGLLSGVLFLLDNVFFPGVRRVKISKPVFIVGHPRSGTTLLHRLLGQTEEFAVFRLWEILLPSLTARKLAGRFIMRRIQEGKGVLLPSEVGHEVSLGSIEEEELLFMHMGNTQFVTLLTPLGFSDWDFGELVYGDEQPEPVRKETLRFFRKCLQRQIRYRGKAQVIAKLNYSGMRLRSLLEEFPDAKLIYVVRSPYETIPSHLSLHRQMFDRKWGLENIPADRLQRYFKRRYRYDVAFYRYVEDLIEKGTFDASQLMVLSYNTLTEDHDEAVRAVVEFAGLELNDQLWTKIREQSRTQTHYRREHRNLPLEDFGLSREVVAHDLRFVFNKYGFPI
jgi:hypothetical protein